MADTTNLIGVLKHLKDSGNTIEIEYAQKHCVGTVIVVAADYIVVLRDGSKKIIVTSTIEGIVPLIGEDPL